MVFRKIISQKKRNEIESILNNNHPSHQERLWLVGFLSFVGYSEAEIIQGINRENCWQDYDYEYTKYQVAAALRGSRRSGTQSEGESVPSSQPRRVKTWIHACVDIIPYKKHCEPGCEKCTDLRCVEALHALYPLRQRDNW